MLVRSWLDALKSRFTRQATRRERRAAGQSRPLHVESLEDRRVMAFDPAVIYVAGANPQDVVAADFNADGTMDLATANYAGSNVSVLLGNSDGTFQPALNSPTGASPLSVAVGDFNGDGKLDLVTANVSDVSVLLGDGLGGFAAPASIGTGSSSPSSVAVGDFNADGKLDLGVTSNYYDPPGHCGPYGCYPGYYYSQVIVLLGTGGGSFAASVASDLGRGYHLSAAVADFNSDSKDDFAALNTDYGTVSVLLGTDIGLGTPASFTTGLYPRALTVGDFTGDGILDLATAGNTVDILPGNGDGTFIPVVRQFVDPVALATADFNDDGHLDLVTADGSKTVSVLLGAGAGTLTPPLVFAAGSVPKAVAVGDFNGDGRPDVAAANVGSDDVSVLLNDGDWPALDAPAISITDVTITEGNTGTATATFNVNLSATYTQPVSIHYATASGTAVAGSDFAAMEGTLTFTPGQTSQPITVLVTGDQLAEDTEAFYVGLISPTNAFIADAQGVGTIVDDEPIVSIESNISAAEGNTGTTPFIFTVTLSAPYEGTVLVPFATADLPWWAGGTATAGVDYTAASGTLTFTPGDTTETITVLVNGDRVPEPNERFWVNLGQVTSAHLGTSQSVGTIVDDEPYAYFGNSASMVEGHSGSKDMVFTVLLTAPYDAPVTVGFWTGGGSATPGSDYQATSGSVTFDIGQTTQTISIPVYGDRLGEYDEYFYVILASGELGYATILDDEPRLSINSVSLTEGQSGTKLMTFTVSLSAAYDQPVTVNYSTQDGSAVAGSDYVATAGMLTFSPGQTSKTITVAIKGDKTKEYDEYFYVVLSDASDNVLLYNSAGYGTIINDDFVKGPRH